MLCIFPIEVYLKSDNFPQIFFTTHETGLLNLDLFRRDQIWFTELKKEDRSTELYSLAEIRNIRKDDNFGKGYISGHWTIWRDTFVKY